MNAPNSDALNSAAPMAVIRRHLRFGWMALLVSLTLGLVLEALHGFKVGWYLDVGQETRRMMWTLAHVHGTLLALVNLGFAFSVRLLPQWAAGPRRVASGALLAASVLMPGGFLLGGIYIYGGDPGLGVLLVPPGGLLLFLAVALTGMASLKMTTEGSSEEAPPAEQPPVEQTPAAKPADKKPSGEKPSGAPQRTHQRGKKKTR